MNTNGKEKFCSKPFAASFLASSTQESNEESAVFLGVLVENSYKTVIFK